ncbi:ncsA, partial [Symbiodinium sp. KB8]
WRLGASMGTGPSKSKSAAVRAASDSFTPAERVSIQALFKDLTSRSEDGQTVDKETFLMVFPLPGLLGEQLFAVFDSTNGQGKLVYEDFIVGLATICRGTPEERAGFIFRLFDIRRRGYISPQDLRTLLSHIPGAVLSVIYRDSLAAEPEDKPHTAMVDALVRSLFKTFNAAHDGKMKAKEFERCLGQHPGIVVYLSSVFPFGDKPAVEEAGPDATRTKRRSVVGVGTPLSAAVPAPSG